MTELRLVAFGSNCIALSGDFKKVIPHNLILISDSYINYHADSSKLMIGS